MFKRSKTFIPFEQSCRDPFHLPEYLRHLVGEAPTAIEQLLFGSDIKIAIILQVLLNLPLTLHILSQVQNQFWSHAILGVYKIKQSL